MLKRCYLFLLFFTDIKNNLFIKVAPCLFLIGYGALFVRSLYRPLTPDEYEGVHTGWKILQGQVIFTDFFQHHHPLTFYLWAALIKLFGETFFVMRVARFLQFCFFSLTLFFSYCLGSLLFNKQAALSGLVLLLAFTLFTPCAIDIRPDILSLTLVIVALFYLFQAFKNNNQCSFGISGFALALSFLCIQKIIIFIPLIAIVLVYEWYYSGVNTKNIAIYAIFSGLPVVGYVGYLLFTGNFNDYYICNVVFNTQLLNGHLPIKMFIDSLQDNAALWTFFFVGLYFCKERFQRYAAFIVLCGLLFMFFMKIDFPHYYMPCFLLVSLVAGYGFVQVFKTNDRLASFILMGLTIGQLVRPYSCAYKRPNIFDDQKRSEYAHFLTSQNERMYNRRPYLNLYRNDLDYLWFVPLFADKFFEKYDKKYDLLSLVKDKNPAILYEPYGDLLEDSYIKSHYIEDYKYANLFVRKDLFQKKMPINL